MIITDRNRRKRTETDARRNGLSPKKRVIFWYASIVSRTTPKNHSLSLNVPLFSEISNDFLKKLFFAEFKSTEQADDAGKNFRKEALEDEI